RGDRVPAPAHDEVGTTLVVQDACVAQDVIDRVRDAVRVVQVETLAAEYRVVYVHDVAQHGEQMLLDTADHLSVDEGVRRRILHFELDTPGLAAEPYLEILVAVEDRADVVGLQARGQHGEGAAAEQLIDPALA